MLTPADLAWMRQINEANLPDSITVYRGGVARPPQNVRFEWITDDVTDEFLTVDIPRPRVRIHGSLTLDLKTQDTFQLADPQGRNRTFEIIMPPHPDTAHSVQRTAIAELKQ